MMVGMVKQIPAIRYAYIDSPYYKCGPVMRQTVDDNDKYYWIRRRSTEFDGYRIDYEPSFLAMLVGLWYETKSLTGVR